jgi:hypothetical protein
VDTAFDAILRQDRRRRMRTFGFAAALLLAVLLAFRATGLLDFARLREGAPSMLICSRRCFHQIFQNCALGGSLSSTPSP